jgi:hypothetical protein
MTPSNDISRHVDAGGRAWIQGQPLAASSCGKPNPPRAMRSRQCAATTMASWSAARASGSSGPRSWRATLSGSSVVGPGTGRATCASRRAGDEHERVIDGFVDAGFVLLGGPPQGDREVLLIVEAEFSEAIRERDPWAQSGRLRPASIERWTVVLDGLR